jgi:hypothetical protein
MVPTKTKMRDKQMTTETEMKMKEYEIEQNEVVVKFSKDKSTIILERTRNDGSKDYTYLSAAKVSELVL